MMLPDVNCADFDEFLAIIYPSDFRRLTKKTTVQWTSILHLAAKWDVGNIKLLAINNLTATANPLDKIILGRRYGITDWLPGAYDVACMRADPLTVEEGMMLGVEDTVRISGARQLYGTGTARHETKYLAGDLGEIFRLETPSEGSVSFMECDEGAVQLLEEQVAAARMEHLTHPTPAVRACMSPGEKWNGCYYDSIACGSCEGCKPESNELRVQRETKEEKERQLGDLNSRLEERQKELAGRQGRMLSFR